MPSSRRPGRSRGPMRGRWPRRRRWVRPPRRTTAPSGGGRFRGLRPEAYWRWCCGRSLCGCEGTVYAGSRVLGRNCVICDERRRPRAGDSEADLSRGTVVRRHTGTRLGPRRALAALAPVVVAVTVLGTPAAAAPTQQTRGAGLDRPDLAMVVTGGSGRTEAVRSHEPYFTPPWQ